MWGKPKPDPSPGDSRVLLFIPLTPLFVPYVVFQVCGPFVEMFAESENDPSKACQNPQFKAIKQEDPTQDIISGGDSCLILCTSHKMNVISLFFSPGCLKLLTAISSPLACV